MAANPVNWFEIYVQDMDRARKFYETVLDTQLQSLPGGPDGELNMQAFPMAGEAPGATGALVRAEGVDSGNNSTLVYFSCADCAQEESRVEAAGGSVERAKTSIGDYGFVTLARDTEGNRFGLHSMQ